MDGTEPMTRLDGSMIDMTEHEDGTLPLPAERDQSPSEVQEGEVENMEGEEEFIQDQDEEDGVMEEALTPATDNTCSSKSLPDSGTKLNLILFITIT